MPQTKKSIAHRVFRWLSDVALKALAVFAILSGAFYVYANHLTWPAEPHPPRGLIATFVGISQSPYSGTNMDYSLANDLCRNDARPGVLGSHICSAEELINSYQSPVQAILSQTGVAFINNGPPGYIQYLINDCSGWRTNSPTTFGSVWNFTTQSGSSTACNQSLPFACCR